MKKKGTRGERELFHLFWNTNKWSAIRTAGSGSTTLPAPDILASNKKRYLAIECKLFKNNIKYFKEGEIEQLMEFSRRFNSEPWIAIKFDYQQWRFLKPKHLTKTKNGIYSISKDLAVKKGINFNELTK